MDDKETAIRLRRMLDIIFDVVNSSKFGPIRHGTDKQGNPVVDTFAMNMCLTLANSVGKLAFEVK